MAKISKNIKRLRTEKGFTQDLLAEKLYISRQAVSSWENDRTQPDVEMLAKLSEIFEVSIEELIYGKKHNTNLETEKPNYNSTLMIVFSILGALLVGVGLVLIFVTFWQDMPLFSKGLLSFLPLIAGQASGLFVLMKKKDKVPWCEGGSVLWTAGIAATLTLIYNIFDLSIDWQNILLLVTLSVMPIIVMLRSVAPLAVYYGCSISWGYSVYEEKEALLALILAVVFLVVGCVHSAYLLKNENKSHRSVFAVWLSVIAVTAFIFIMGMGIEDIALGLVGLMTVFICLYLLSFRDGDMAMPYKIPGLLGTAALMFVSGWIYFSSIEANKYNVIYVAVCIIAIIVTALVAKLSGKDRFALVYIGAVCVSYIISICSLYAMGDSFDEDIAELFLAVLRVPALVGYVAMIIAGGREKKLIPINVGFVGVSAITIVLVAQSGLSMLGNGIMLLIFGGILLAINFKISRSKQKTPDTENNGEVQSDEK